MLRIVAGRAHAGFLTGIYNQMGQGVAQGRRQVLIVPETRSHEAEKGLLMALGNPSGRLAQVLTFTKLAERVLATLNRPVESLEAGSRILLMHRALSRAKSSLRYYRHAALRPELIDKLLSFTDELKSCLITPEQFLQACDQDGLPDKLRDIGVIYAQYCAEGQPFGLDGKDRLAAAADQLPASGLFDGAAVYVQGFAGFTQQEYAVLRAMLELGLDVGVYLLLGEGRDPLFSEQQKTRGRLLRLAARVPCKAEELRLPNQPEGRPGELLFVEDKLFSYETAEYEGPCQAVSLYRAENPGQECELAAALARHLALDGGLRYREIAVACGDLDAYAKKLETAFARFDTPLFLSQKEDLLQKPPVTAVLGYLAALQRGLTVETVMTCLKTGLNPLSREEWEELENYAYLWNIRGRRWLEPWTMPVDGYAKLDPRGPDKLERLNEVRQRAMAPFAALQEELRQCRKGGDYVGAMLRHLDRCGFEERMEGKISELQQAGRKRQASEYAQLYQILLDALAQFDRVMKDEPVTSEDFAGLLRLTLSQSHVSAIPVSLDNVGAGDFQRVGTGGIKHLIVIGARDGVLPPPVAASSLLTPSERIMLEGAGIELTQSDEQRAFESQSAIYRAMSAPTGGLTLIYPASAGGAECRPSFLVGRLLRLFPGLTVADGGQALRELSLEAATPAFELACAWAAGVGGDCERRAYRHFERQPDKLAYFDRLRQYSAAPRGPLRREENISALYGDQIRLTASRIERISSCHFSYFMQYGLKAKPRRPARFGAPEVGTFVHYVVEHAVRQLSEFPDQSPDDVVKWHIDAFLQRELGGAGDKTARFRGVFRALSRTVAAIVRNVLEELEHSAFQPLDFELDFGPTGDVPPLTLRSGRVTLAISGKIDRVDGYVRDGKLYVKVVDYKTGDKAFHLSDVLYGLNMQMFLYLLMLQQGGAGHLLERAQLRLGETAEEAESAGALYIPAKSPFVAAERGESDGEIRARIDKALRRFGLILDDPSLVRAMEDGQGGFRFLPLAVDKEGGIKATSLLASSEQFGRLMRKVQRELGDIAASLAGGDIEATPYRTGKEFTACDWCEYRAACHFDLGMRRDRLRFCGVIPPDEVYERLREEEENGSSPDARAATGR